MTIEDIFRVNILALEQVVREPETQISGLVVLLDMAGLSLQHAKFFTPYYAKRMVELVQETFPLRFKGFHVVNEPFYFDAIMTVLKPFLKDKIRKRVRITVSEMGRTVVGKERLVFFESECFNFFIFADLSPRRRSVVFARVNSAGSAAIGVWRRRGQLQQQAVVHVLAG